MSRRIDKSWVVLRSIENGEHDRCVDLFRRPDGSFGFDESAATSRMPAPGRRLRTTRVPPIPRWTTP
jgi:hypothetical protein